MSAPFGLRALAATRPSQPKRRAADRRFRPRVEALEDRAVPATFTVTNVLDSGPGSLRQAIADANTTANVGGPDRIEFHIDPSLAGADGTFTIRPATQLPPVTDPVVLDGYTQDGARENTLKGVGRLGVDPGDLTQYGDNAVLKVRIDGNNDLTRTGLELAANSVVQGLVITGFGAGIVARAGATIHGNFIGIDAAGASSYDAAGKSFGMNNGVILSGNQPVTIGGPNPGDRNLICGASRAGVYGGGTMPLTIQGNFFGTNRDGTSIYDNQGRSLTSNTAVFDGGATTLVTSNLISGSTYGLSFAQSGGYVARGNFFGTDVTGTRGVDAAGRKLSTHYAVAASSPIVFGGTEAGAGNLVASGISGVRLFGEGSVVQGNYFGTNVLGGRTDARGADVFGFDGSSGAIDIYSANQLIGGADPNAGNLIAGQVLVNGTDGQTIQRNHFLSGAIAVHNRSVVRDNWGQFYINVAGSQSLIENNNLGHASAGIILTSGASSNVIRGNTITDCGYFGIGPYYDSYNTHDNLIDSNVLIGNAMGGVQLVTGSGDLATRNVITRDGTPFVYGAIRTINGTSPALAAPVLTGVSGTAVTGTFAGHAGERVRIEFFANAGPDPVGNQKAEQYLGSADVTVAADGSFTAPAPAVPLARRYLTATATVRLHDVAGPAGTMTVGDTSPVSATFFVSNLPPTARAGGPYSVTYGGSVTLDASASSDPDGDPLTYSWTINGRAGAATGVRPTLSWAALASLGLVPGTSGYSVSVTVDDGHGHVVTSDPTTLAALKATLTATGVAVASTAGAPFNGTVAKFTNVNPYEGTSSYAALITWGDGYTSAGTITDLGSGTFAVTGSHTYADPGTATVQVQISHVLGYTTTAAASAIATATDGHLTIQPGQVQGFRFWYGANGQGLINAFNGGSTSTALSAWLSTNFANLYGVRAGANNLTGRTNAQVAAFYQSLFNQGYPTADALVLTTALNVYATTLSLGGTAATVYGFRVDANGLGAVSFNIGPTGRLFGTADYQTLNVFQMLRGVDKKSVNGVLYGGDPALRNQINQFFLSLNG